MQSGTVFPVYSFCVHFEENSYKHSSSLLEIWKRVMWCRIKVNQEHSVDMNKFKISRQLLHIASIDTENYLHG